MRYQKASPDFRRTTPAAARLLVAAVALSLAALPAHALVVNQWGGSGTDNYNVGSNWLQNRVPTGGDQATIYSGSVTLYASPVTVGGVLVSKIGSAGQLFTSSFKLTVGGATAIDNGGQLYVQGVSGGSVGFQTASLALTSGSLVDLQFSNSNASVTGTLSIDATSNLTTEGTLTVGGVLTDNGVIHNNGSTIHAGTFTLVGTSANHATLDANGQSLTLTATTFNLSNTFSTIDVSDFAGSLDLEGSPSSNIGAAVNVGDSSHLTFGNGFWAFGYYSKSGAIFVPNGSVNLNGGTTLARAATINSYGTYFTSVNVTNYANMVSGEFDGASSVNVAAGGHLAVGSPYFRGTSFSSTISLNGPGTINMSGDTAMGLSGAGIPSTTVSVAANTIFNWEGTSGANATLTLQNAELDVYATSIQNRLVFSGFFFVSTNGYDGNISLDSTSTLNVAGAPWTLFGTMNLGPGAVVQGQTLTISGSSAPAGTYALYPAGNAGVFPIIQAPVVLNANATIYLASGGGLNMNGNTTYAGGSVITAPYTLNPYGTLVQNGNATVTANTTLLCNTLDMDGTANNATWSITPGAQLTLQASFLDANNSTANPVHSTLTIGGTLDVESKSGQWTLAGGTINFTGTTGIVQHDKLILGSGSAVGTVNVANGTSGFITGGLESAATPGASGNVVNLLGYLVVSNGLTFDANSVLTETGNFDFEIETTPTCAAGSVFNCNGGSADFSFGIPGPANLSINAQNSGIVGLFGASNLKSLHIFAGSSAILPVGGSNTLFTNSLVIDGGTTPTGSLGITNNKVIVEATANHAATFATLQAQVAYGNTHPPFGGIYDNYLPAHYGIAVLDNAVLGKSTFGGVVVDANSILISQELLGDSNADGVVDLTDLNTVLNHLGVTTPNWTNGNFDGATTIDLNDLNDVLNNLGVHNANATAVTADSLLPTQNVPEPASLALVAAGVGSSALTRRHRDRSVI